MSRLSAIGLGLLALVIFPAGLLSCLTCTWRMIGQAVSLRRLPKQQAFGNLENSSASSQKPKE